MLKKVIIGLICFILLLVVGAGIYIYTLDWNKHKDLVVQRLTQITGLKSSINGNLKVELFPQPKITAQQVKFFSSTDAKNPLINVNEITANLELAPLFDNKFIIKSMSLVQPSVNIIISEKGELNWQNVGKNSRNKSGNVVMSFDDVRLSGATVAFSDLQEGTEFSIPNISASISAPSLQGPYKTNGKFIHNNSEILFNGTISQNDKTSLNMTIENAATGSKLSIDGDMGEQAKGTINFDTRSLTDIVTVIFGQDTLNNHYKEPLFISFQYNYDAKIAQLDNFTTKYGNNITGSGNVMLNLGDVKNIAAEFNMAKFDLNVLETIVRDYINANKNIEEKELPAYDISLKLRAPTALYKDAETQNLNLGFNFKQGILDVTSFNVVMPGETTVRTVGKVNLSGDFQYIFKQDIKSQDIKILAALFGIDLTKYAAPENKKSIFKRLSTNLELKGDLNNFVAQAPKVEIDSTKLGFDIQMAKIEDKTLISADIAASKVLFDKYVQVLPENIKTASIKDKFIYQLKLVPWNNNYTTEARISIDSAVYNKIPMENVTLQLSKENDNLKIESLAIKSIANAEVNLSADVEKIFTEPKFNDLSYNIKTSNFPLFTSSIGLNLGSKDLFKRKLFAAQGVLAGTFNDFNLSSVQKFGDAEFSYTGEVLNPDKGQTTLNGDLEFKTPNFTTFVKALNFDYNPTIPVTSFYAAGKFNGNADLFVFNEIKAHLGANSITGMLQFDNNSDKPKVKAELDFDKVDADRWFNLSHKKDTGSAEMHNFIAPITFNDEKIDYLPLYKVDFDIKANTRSFVYNNTAYLETKADMKLKDGELNVVSFETKDDTSTIGFDFLLNSKDTPTIKGKYSVSGIKTPNIGGTVYQFSSGLLNADGTFDSIATTQKEFFENLNSDGNFQLIDTSFRGWDLDIIKFELEQRKTTTGLEDFIRRNLATGTSAFSKIGGKYSIKNGVVNADKILWESPTANIDMKLNWNLKTNLFNALFDTTYHNASFSDNLEFSLDGNLSNPELKCNLENILNRIGETEQTINSALAQKEQEKTQKLKSKKDSIKIDVDNALSEISNITPKVENFKPVSDNKNIAKTYDENIELLDDIKLRINALDYKLQRNPTEKELMDMEAELKIELSKLTFIPKNLEDNYILDRKYIYDEIFNKIAWLYDLATNNLAYFDNLSNSYVRQVALMKTGETALSQDVEDNLLKSVNKVTMDMEKINDLYSKMRDDYLFIVDTNNIEVMNDNNEIASQALDTILSYVNTLNNDIVYSLESFAKALELSGNNYKENLIQAPLKAQDIDVTKPVEKAQSIAETQKSTETISNDEGTSVNVSTEKNPVNLEEDKKKVEEQQAQLLKIKNNISLLIKNIKSNQKTKQDIQIASNINSSGLSALIPVIKEVAPVIAENSTQIAADVTNAPAAEESVEVTPVMPENSTQIAEADVTNAPATVEPVEVTPVMPENSTQIAEADVIDALATEESVEVTHVMPENSTQIAEADVIDAPATVEPVEVAPVMAETNTQIAEADVIDAPATVESLETTPVMATADVMEMTIIPQPVEGISEEKTSPNENIEQKIQIALNDVLEEVKKEEGKIVSFLSETVKPAVENIENENLPDLKEVNVNDFTIAESEVKHMHKRNPVIAFNIGKDLASTALADLKLLDKKDGFKTKKFRYKDIVKSFAEKTKINLPITIHKAMQNRVVLSKKMTLPTIVAYSEGGINVSDLPENLAQHLSPSESFQNNKYVFVTENSDLSTVGNIGKNMLKNKKDSISKPIETKYLFAANDTPFLKFEGSLGKISSINLK